MDGCSTGPGPARLSVAEVLRAALGQAQRPPLSRHQRKILNALVACQTPQLGGHRYRCEDCGREHFVPRSCGNRHCPNCQWRQAAQWLERQESLLLPAPYFHVVFTLPHALNPLIEQNQRACYGLLLGSAAQTLLEFGRNNLGAQLGLTLVLHTWSQTLLDHCHVHCIVTGGGLALDGSRWKGAGDTFLFPVRALSKVFEGKFCAGLQERFAQKKLEFHGQLAALGETKAFQALMREARAKSWNVYAKRPFAGPHEVLRYLSRYTHRVAITPRRLIRLDRERGVVEFSFQQRRDPARPVWKTMELELPEFLRRFCLHILPERFVKIRHYGLLANRGRQERVVRARAMLEAATPMANPATPSGSSGPEAHEPKEDAAEAKTERLVCPHCGHRALVWVGLVPRSADPGPDQPRPP